MDNNTVMYIAVFAAIVAVVALIMIWQVRSSLNQSAAPAPAAAPKAAAPAGGAGNVKIEAGAAGKVFKIESSVGASVKKGDTILVLEIMKMETPVVATEDGTVASINVSVGDMVEAGALLATLNN